MATLLRFTLPDWLDDLELLDDAGWGEEGTLESCATGHRLVDIHRRFGLRLEEIHHHLSDSWDTGRTADQLHLVDFGPLHLRGVDHSDEHRVDSLVERLRQIVEGGPERVGATELSATAGRYKGVAHLLICPSTSSSPTRHSTRSCTGEVVLDMSFFSLSDSSSSRIHALGSSFTSTW